MTAPTPEKIQRWEPDMKYIGTGECVAVLSKSDDGDAVMHEDHLRHLKLAQIAVLGEMAFLTCPYCHNSGIADRELFISEEAPDRPHHLSHDGDEIDCYSIHLHIRIAALRKELGG